MKIMWISTGWKIKYNFGLFGGVAFSWAEGIVKWVFAGDEEWKINRNESKTCLVKECVNSKRKNIQRKSGKKENRFDDSQEEGWQWEMRKLKTRNIKVVGKKGGESDTRLNDRQKMGKNNRRNIKKKREKIIKIRMRKSFKRDYIFLVFWWIYDIGKIFRDFTLRANTQVSCNEIHKELRIKQLAPLLRWVYVEPFFISHVWFF